jgi:Flp pilus assembly protein TadG
MQRFKLRRHVQGDERGQALVEFALMSVVFFMLIFGILDMARLFQSWNTTQHAARTAARYAITGRSDCDGAATRDACITWTAKDSTSGLENGGPTASDTNVLVSFKAWDFDGSNWTGSGVNNETGKQCDQIEVTVQYKHHFATPVLQIFAPSGLNIYGRQRMTNEPFGQCNPSDGVT